MMNKREELEFRIAEVYYWKLMRALFMPVADWVAGMSENQIDCWIYGKPVRYGWGWYYPIICKLTDIWAD